MNNHRGSFSEAFSNSFNTIGIKNKKSNQDNLFGRSYVGSFNQNSGHHDINSSERVHQETADIADVFDSESPSISEEEPQEISRLLDYESQRYETIEEVEKPSNFARQLISYCPAVLLGLLLNILDALSYGMIIFPIAEPVFAHLGPSGLSMFYVSSIVSQLIYSCGASTFGAGVGSEMIEITPFFHTMAISIMNQMSDQDAIIATTITCYAASTLVTGLTFFLLGKLRLGKLVGFFPRHILIGCIGGVGYFLIVTGLEVTTRAAKFEYSWEFLLNMFANTEDFLKWSIPVVLTILLVYTQHRVDHSLVLPVFYLSAFLLFHFVVAIIPSLSLDYMRSSGWIFPVSKTKESWYDFYKLYKFSLVDWGLVVRQIPTMLALTFFGVLHVPINVPALAMSLQIDKYDVDKELIAHGYSNFLSGAIGSIQNYLVYTNSVMFIRAGGDSRAAGVLLAAGTAVVMVVGPVIVSVIPIAIVGSLIFLLGYELLKESLIDTYGKLKKTEYITIVVIVLVMGIIDFVDGIAVGIAIAACQFVVESVRLQTINSEFDGHTAKSTVYRDHVQRQYLENMGEQIYILKLQNLLFFGTILSIEAKIDELIELHHIQSVKYLVLDFKNINTDNIDFSAAEGFNRIKRTLETKRIQLIISSIGKEDEIYQSFNNVGLLDSVELFQDLNSALEWCENKLLTTFKQVSSGPMRITSVSASNKRFSIMNTPRNAQALNVSHQVFQDEQRAKFKDLSPPMSLFMSSMRDYSSQSKEFWSPLGPYFRRYTVAEDSIVFNNKKNPKVFFVVESGMMKINYELKQSHVYTTILSKTSFGCFSSSSFLSVEAETAAAIWIIDNETLERLKSENLVLYTELLNASLNISNVLYQNLLEYSLVSS